MFLARQRDTDPSKPPQFSFGKKDRRVTMISASLDAWLWLRSISQPKTRIMTR